MIHKDFDCKNSLNTSKLIMKYSHLLLTDHTMNHLQNLLKALISYNNIAKILDIEISS